MYLLFKTIYIFFVQIIHGICTFCNIHFLKYIPRYIIFYSFLNGQYNIKYLDILTMVLMVWFTQPTYLKLLIA